MSDQIKQCELCGNSFLLVTGRGSSNRISCYSCTNKPKNRAIQYRNKHLKKKYGITQNEYLTMFTSQSGRCAICKRELINETTKLTSGCSRNPQEPIVDHQHTSGKVRGILCFHCNTALGHLFDNVEVMKEMINYVSKE